MSDGLSGAEKLKVGTGYVQGTAVLVPQGIRGRLEAGAKPWERVTVFGYGELGHKRDSWSAGLGGRWNF